MIEKFEKRFYIFERDGPYKWQLAKYEVGPYYSVENILGGNDRGYETKEDAEKDINRAYEEGSSEPYYIIEGYSKVYF